MGGIGNGLSRLHFLYVSSFLNVDPRSKATANKTLLHLDNKKMSFTLSQAKGRKKESHPTNGKKGRNQKK
jgi:hypothetical protein